MSAWRKFVDLHNRASDYKVVWWPFLFLKPEPHVPISFKRTLIMAPCFGAYFLAAYLVRRAFDPDAVWTAVVILELFIWFTLGFFLWFNSVTARLWNVRAHELSRNS